MLKPLSYADEVRIFGHVKFTPKPTDQNPERVVVSPAWGLANLREVMIPQLAKIGGPRHSITAHYKTVRRLAALWQSWEDEGLLPLVKTWNGCWSTRFKRQSGSIEVRKQKCLTLAERNLSAHCRGTAMDINAALLPLGTVLPLSDPFRELVPTAEHYGFAWGGNFVTRPDPMHLQDVVGEV